MLKLSCVAVATLLLTSWVSLGQEYRGTISGMITDQSGAAIPGAKITATETGTGTKSATISEATGAYTIPFLAPGQYTITAEAPGFKEFVRKGVTLSAGEHPVIHIQMQLGTMNQSVTVTAESPLINTSNASIGQTISTKDVENIPVNGRTPLELATLSLGVISTIPPGPVRPFDNPGGNFEMGGAPVGDNELLMDGAPDAGPAANGTLAYSPPQDSVLEVHADVFNTDAAYGHAGGGTVNQILKSGTNSFHGTAYEFNQESVLDANEFFTAAAGQPTPSYRQNQYGVGAGGPIVIPKIYNGKNKFFWYFAYEGLRDSDPANSPLETGNPLNYATVPTPAERTGDFSALLALGANYTIYNPYTAVQSGSTITRQPFASNVIPANLLNPISLAILKYFPQPNLPGKPNGSANYAVNAVDSDVYDNELGRLDYNVSDTNKLTFNARHSARTQDKNNWFNNAATGTILYRINQGATLDDVETFSPTLVMDTRLNWTRWIQQHASPADGFDLTSLGFPPYLESSSEHLNFPYIIFTSCSVAAGVELSYQCLGNNGDGINTYDTYQLFNNFSKVTGNHTIQFGADIRDYRESAYIAGNSAGTYTFNGNAAVVSNVNSSWTNGPTASAASSPLGQDLAAFLLGLPSSGSIDLNTQSTVGEHYFAFYFQDDWRVKPNLVFNLGLRWEHESPITERYNRAVNGFDPTEVNPISAPAAAAYASLYASGAYAKSSIPAIPPSQFTALGALTFASPSDRYVYHMNSKIFSPRIGFAWTPHTLGGNTVLRGGFGIFMDPIGVANNLTLNQQGFSETTQMVTTNNNFLSPATTLSNPFPSGILPPAATAGPGAFLGQAISFFNPQENNPYSIRWDFGIQQQLSHDMVLEVAYIGNHAVHLPINAQVNYLPRQYLSTSPTRDNALVSALTASVPNPFQGLLPNSNNMNGKTIAFDQLLAPYPQFPLGSGTSGGIIDQATNAGSSYYESLNVRFQKRFSNGLTFINNFVWDSLIGRLTYLNDSDTAPVKTVTPDSRPLQNVLSAVYDLPFGHGRQFNIHSRLLDAVAGGWTLSGVLTFGSGPPLSWGNVIYYGGPLHFNPHQPNGYSFDITRFNTVSSQQLADNIRTFDPYFNNLRADGTRNLDASLSKNFYFTENAYFQLRFETFNTTNSVTFAAPNLSPTNSAFGQIRAQANTPRRVQIGARIVW
jgi:hypothetical protein